jgi:hypothetical protein
VVKRNMPKLSDTQYVWICKHATSYLNAVELAYEMGQANALAVTDKDFKLAARLVGSDSTKVAVSTA